VYLSHVESQFPDKGARSIQAWLAREVEVREEQDLVRAG